LVNIVPDLFVVKLWFPVCGSVVPPQPGAGKSVTADIDTTEFLESQLPDWN